MASKLRAHFEGTGQEASGVPGVFPRVRAVPPPPPRAPVVGSRFSSIDGLPLGQGRANRTRSRSRSPRAGAASESRGGFPSSSSRRRGALYFVEAFAHRTLARCEACSLGLAQGLEAASGYPMQRTFVLGFRLARVPPGEAPVRWSHTSAECLARLGLPQIRSSDAELDVVFSPDVTDSARAAVLQRLVARPAEVSGAGCGSSMTQADAGQFLRVERWTYAASALQRRWSNMVELAQRRHDEAGVDHVVVGRDLAHLLPRVRLLEEDLARMGQRLKVPLCG
ncbi:unnamed protein product, partial [Polarella glacialis]